MSEVEDEMEVAEAVLNRSVWPTSDVVAGRSRRLVFWEDSGAVTLEPLSGFNEWQTSDVVEGLSLMG